MRPLALAMLVCMSTLVSMSPAAAQKELEELRRHNPQRAAAIKRATDIWMSCWYNKVAAAHRRYPDPLTAAEAVFQSCQRYEERLRGLGVSDRAQSLMKQMITRSHFVNSWGRFR